MRNADRWRPTKFERRGGRLGAGPKPFRGSRFFVDLVGPVYERLLAEHARGVLADLGCGTVPLWACYRDRVERAVCLDWPGSVHDRLHVDALADLSAGLPLRDASVDTVLLTDVLEHVRRPGVLMGEVARVLCPDGRCLVATPFLYWLHERPHDYYRYTDRALAGLAEDSGLQVLELRPYGGAAEVGLDLLSKAVGRSRVASGMVEGLVRWLHPATRDEAWAPKPDTHFPLGYVMVAARLAV